jgi:hypothetical protein
MTMARPLAHQTTAAGRGEITDIDLYAWLAQADAGDALIYHRGFLAVDTDKLISDLPAERRDALRSLGDAAFRAAEQGLVHLVQERIGPNQFAYIAIARPKPKPPCSAAITRLLEAV